MSPFVPGVIAAPLLLCTLTAGFLLGFAVVVMPGLRALDDAAYLRAFKVIDGVIQEGQPLFGLMWIGSVAALLAALGLGLPDLTGPDRLLLASAGALYLFGVQLPTAMINIPLNNRLRGMAIEALDDRAAAEMRKAFETRWTRWNAIRTVMAIATAVLLLVLLLRL